MSANYDNLISLFISKKHDVTVIHNDGTRTNEKRNISDWNEYVNTAFPRLYENGTITVCKSIRGRKHVKLSDEKRQERKVKMNELAKIKKSYELTPAKRRTIKCSAIRLFLKKEHSVKFITLTFPGKVSQEYANECFSKFVENCKKTYKLKNYVAVKEFFNKEGKLHTHFHCLFDIPFTRYSVLNRAWCSTFRGVLPYSRNALTTGKRSIIKTAEHVTRYITKYISKAVFPEGIEPELFESLNSARTYFISEDTLSQSKLIDVNTWMVLLSGNQFKAFESENFIVFCLKDFTCLPENVGYQQKRVTEKPSKIPDRLQPNLNFSLSF